MKNESHTHTHTHATQGQLIYVEYAPEYLAFRPRWNLEELCDQGPGGLYALSMTMLTNALQRDAPTLLPLLHNKLLPVLVAAREPLSRSQLVAACGGGCDAEVGGQLWSGGGCECACSCACMHLDLLCQPGACLE